MGHIFWGLGFRLGGIFRVGGGGPPPGDGGALGQFLVSLII